MRVVDQVRKTRTKQRKGSLLLEAIDRELSNSGHDGETDSPTRRKLSHMKLVSSRLLAWSPLGQRTRTTPTSRCVAS